MPLAKKIAFSLAAAVLSLLLLEASLHALRWLLPTPAGRLGLIHPIIHDDTLVWRPNPDYPGYDRAGFRNASRPGSADLVALGDSQTYGANVAREQAWPQQLGARTGQAVYNMGFGGYCALHSLLLWPEVEALQPRAVIQAVYAGNDLFDAFSLVYEHDKLPALRSRNPIILRTIDSLQHEAPLSASISRMFRQEAALPRLRDWLSDHNALYQVAGAAKRWLHAQQSRDWAQEKATAAEQPDFYDVFETDSLRTVFTPAYRLRALNQHDPRLAEGLRLLQTALAELRRRSVAGGRDFLVLLLPTKELTFAEQTRADSLRYSPEYWRLVAQEKVMWQQMRHFLQAEGIAFVDATQVLQAALEQGVSPFPRDSDGHLSAAGQRLVAEAIKKAWRREPPG